MPLMEIPTPFPQTPIGSWIRLGFPKPTVSPVKSSLVYFISIVSIDYPVWRGHRDAAKRGPPCGPRITRNEGARVPLLLPCATTGLSSITAWCGRGATPRGQQWPPACTVPHVRDGLRVRCSRATLCPCGSSSRGRPAHHQFLRNALPDLTTIVPIPAYYSINSVRVTVGLYACRYAPARVMYS